MQEGFKMEEHIQESETVKKQSFNTLILLTINNSF